MSIAVTYDEIERTAERTTAYALLAKTATTIVSTSLRTYELVRALELLLGMITQERVDQLDPSRVDRLTAQLQKVHAPLVEAARSPEVQKVLNVPILGKFVLRVHDLTEELSDLIENLVLSRDPAFKKLIASCMTDIFQ